MDLYASDIYRADIAQVLREDIPWERLEGSTVLITGATGMIASVIIDILMCQNRNAKQRDKKISVLAVSRREQAARERFGSWWEEDSFTWISHNVNAPLPELGKVDYILHAASNTHPKAYASDPIGTITANVLGTYQLLEYAASHQCRRFFFFSSVEIYGENRGDTDKFGETYLGYLDCNTLRAGYPESKRLGEALCNAFFSQKDQDFVIGRFSRVYGPSMSDGDSKAIAQFLKKAAAGEDIVLKSEGAQLYSYTYAVDAAAAALCLLLKGESKSAVNIADSASDIRLRELAGLLAKEAGTRVVYEMPDSVEAAGYSVATKAVLDGKRMEQLGWKAHTPIRQGIGKTLRILREETERGDF